MNLQAQEKQNNNQHFYHSLETTADAARIWDVWTDVPNWKDWDTGLKDAQLNGPFTLNAEGIITSLEGRKSKFKIVEFVEGSSYTMKTKLPLGNLYVKRFLEVQDGKTVFTHEVWFTGLSKGIFAKLFGGKFRSMLPFVMETIKKIAEDDDA